VTTGQREAVAAGFVGGMILGAVLWSTQVHRSRRDLFSRNPVRRLAALGHVGAYPGLDAARLLTEYVGWERHPVLRRRGERLLRRMRSNLD
jgi:hypothetical protein